MIPIRDTLSSKNYPVINTAIIGLNVLVFLIQLNQGGQAEQFIYVYGLVPARYSVPHIASYFSASQQLFSLFSFMFLHGGFWHLLGNMWSLYIFGDNIEDRIGSLRYLLFYLLCGLTSGLSHLLLNPHSNVPTIGASGAIAGVMGAYFLLFPKSRILTLIPILFIPLFIEIPAYFFLGIWFLLQFLSAAGSYGSAGGIAWWAHIGGFLSGMILLKLFHVLPDSGFTQHLRKVTEKRKTPMLQVIRTSGSGSDPHLYGVIQITPWEAFSGANKMVNIPWGFYNRTIRVQVPPNLKQGSIIRLKGMGRQMPEGLKGDLMLKVIIQS
ncbi:MAG: rhomboid family intramembrane serine protease [Deltaproteobacteria bacterium]|nr:rhomboid family intramembrane serine protease [Deltaproteobacteria bacterium]